jgi:GNAT superfamily N-acetyltransferase
MITYQSTLPDKHQYVRLFATTGWNASYQMNADRLLTAIRQSWYYVCAYDGDTLIGFGRLISDGIMHALIVDLIVAPAYQGRGIGREILRRLVERCDAHGIHDVQLFCARGKQSFYEKMQFEARPADGPGMQLRRE